MAGGEVGGHDMTWQRMLSLVGSRRDVEICRCQFCGVVTLVRP